MKIYFLSQKSSKTGFVDEIKGEYTLVSSDLVQTMETELLKKTRGQKEHFLQDGSVLIRVATTPVFRVLCPWAYWPKHNYAAGL